MKKDKYYQAELIVLAQLFCQEWFERVYDKPLAKFSAHEQAQYHQYYGTIIVFITHKHEEIRRISSESAKNNN